MDLTGKTCCELYYSNKVSVQICSFSDPLIKYLFAKKLNEVARRYGGKFRMKRPTTCRVFWYRFLSKTGKLNKLGG